MSGGGRWRSAAVVVVLAAGLLAPVGAVGAQTPPPSVDYDVDDDGLIEVSSLSQLNAIRFDLDGDGTADVYPASSDGYTGHDPDGAAKLAAAFPNAATGMGCPTDGCDGYELAADLDFDTNGNGQADSGDDYWNGGRGWNPLMGGEPIYDPKGHQRFTGTDNQVAIILGPHGRARAFSGVFEGNGHTIANLYINRPRRWYVGLFGYIGPGGHVRNMGLSSPNADSRVRGGYFVGTLAGWVGGGYHTAGGKVSGVWSDVDARGANDVGGLVGGVSQRGFVIESFATGDVAGWSGVGGLAGLINYAGVAAVYATGDVTGVRKVGGLAGWRPDGHVRATYATGSVTYAGGAAHARQKVAYGGLIGALWNAWTPGWPRANYATGQVSVPDGLPAGGLMGECLSSQRPRAEGGNYWDTVATGQATSPDCGLGYTTAQLQAPTGYAGIYSTWNLDIDGDRAGDDPWDFGTSSEYPVLKYCAAKPGIDTADGGVYCPLQPDRQRGGPEPDPVPVVSVSGGGDVAEGAAAVFTVSASPVPAAGLDVTVRVAAVGDFGVATGGRTARVPVSGSVSLSVATVDDSADEADGSVSVTLVDGADYDVGSPGTASVAVADDDVPPPPGVDYDVDDDGLVEVIHPGFCAGSKDWSKHESHGCRCGAGADFEAVFG